MSHARGGNGPAILEATCFRFRGHYEGDHDGYRPRGERERMKRENDPIALYRQKLVARRAASEAELDRAVEESKRAMAEVASAAKAGPLPQAAEVMKYRFVGAA